MKVTTMLVSILSILSYSLYNSYCHAETLLDVEVQELTDYIPRVRDTLVIFNKVKVPQGFRPCLEPYRGTKNILRSVTTLISSYGLNLNKCS